jgi:tetratricopeptide (TPR) repeat protein
MTDASVRPYLRAIPLFRFLSPDAQLAVAHELAVKRLSAGQSLNLRGEHAQVLCIVKSGRLHVQTYLPRYETTRTVLKPGQWTGQELVLGWQQAASTTLQAGARGGEILLLWKRDLKAVRPFGLLVLLVQLLAVLRIGIEDVLEVSIRLICRSRQVAISTALAQPVLTGVLVALACFLAYLLLTTPGRALQADGRYLFLQVRPPVSALEQMEQLARVLRLAPGHSHATVELGTLAADSGDVATARRHYESIAEFDGAGSNDLAVLLLEQGHSAPALDLLLESVDLEPDRAITYQNLGVAYGMVGNKQEALRAFREALRIDPTSTVARYHLALDHLSRRDLVAAGAEFHRILEQDVTCAPAYLGLGLVQREIGDLDQAAHAFEQATQADPGSVIAWFHLGWARTELGRVAEARTALVHVLSGDPPEDLDDRARFLLAEGRDLSKEELMNK